MLYSEKAENSSTASPWKLGDRVRETANYLFQHGMARIPDWISKRK